MTATHNLLLPTSTVITVGSHLLRLLKWMG